MNTLRDRVREALDNAVENGYKEELLMKSSDYIASELNGDLTTIPGNVKLIEKYVREWQKENMS
jgi:hypothetical protein